MRKHGRSIQHSERHIVGAQVMEVSFPLILSSPSLYLQVGALPEMSQRGVSSFTVMVTTVGTAHVPPDLLVANQSRTPSASRSFWSKTVEAQREVARLYYGKKPVFTFWFWRENMSVILMYCYKMPDAEMSCPLRSPWRVTNTFSSWFLLFHFQLLFLRWLFSVFSFLLLLAKYISLINIFSLSRFTFIIITYAHLLFCFYKLRNEIFFNWFNITLRLLFNHTFFFFIFTLFSPSFCFCFLFTLRGQSTLQKIKISFCKEFLNEWNYIWSLSTSQSLIVHLMYSILLPPCNKSILPGLIRASFIHHISV